MAGESSRSNSSADSYIGSLISLTSKSEIRYEGILYNINTEESSIGLRNVRSFGTEGRKKDSPQVLPSDKVYEYILFRGSDIKDLQVKSSAPVQTAPPTPPLTNDPAIIQSHYPRPTSAPSNVPSAGGSLTDFSSHTPQLPHHGSNFQGGLPLYQPGGNLGSWGPSPPPPMANTSGLPIPMYWPGYYAPPNGIPQLHQQSLVRPPPGLSMPPPMQHPIPYPSFSASLPAGVPSLPEYPSPLLSATTSLPNVIVSSPLPSSTYPSTLPSASPVTFVSETIPSLMPNKTATNPVGASAPLSVNLQSLSPLNNSAPDVNAVLPQISNKPSVISTPALPYQGISNPISAVTGASSIQTESTAPLLVTPGQLMSSGQSGVISSQAPRAVHKDVEVVKVSPSPSPSPSAEPPASLPVPTEAQPPILPLPSPLRSTPKLNGAPFQQRNSYRGRERGRGTGSSRRVMKFTEEFDFTAMNEKFNKDEVWGHLGKSNKSKEKGDGIVSEEEDSEDEYDGELPKLDVKPVYSKDDFFDTLSYNTLDNQSNNGRVRFSEQMKLDTETFGEFSRYRGGGRGGRGPYRGGHSRGGYYGRGGYGYVGRGRGGRTSSRDY